MNLKLTSTLLVALALGTAATPLLRAQDQNTTTAPDGGQGQSGKGGRGGKGQGRGPGMMSPEAQVERLDRQLKLTADQKTKLTDIYTKAREDMRADMQNAKGGDRKAAQQKMQQAMQAVRDQVAAVLTDDQKKKFEQMNQGGRGGKGGRGPGGGKRKQSDTN